MLTKLKVTQTQEHAKLKFVTTEKDRSKTLTSRTTISNSNWTGSTIQAVIARVISKSDEREARDRFEITSKITP